MPLAIDLFCGLGGWADGFLAEGYDVVGFDIERHQYEVPVRVNGVEIGRPIAKYPAQLVLQDVLTLDGRQFKDAAVIVASPPCQEFSYMAMPWSRAKAKAAYIRERQTEWARLTALFWACFRIAREAQVPLVVENVKGAQPWVGGARWHYGSFYLWGDVPALMPITFNGVMKRGVAHRSNGETNFHGSAARAIKNDSGSWFAIGSPGQQNVGQNPDGRKVPGMNFHEHEKTGKPGRSFQSAAVEAQGTKVSGDWFGSYEDMKAAGTISPGRLHGKGSTARKAASAQIAKIPFPLARHIARVFKPT